MKKLFSKPEKNAANPFYDGINLRSLGHNFCFSIKELNFIYFSFLNQTRLLTKHEPRTKSP